MGPLPIKSTGCPQSRGVPVSLKAKPLQGRTVAKRYVIDVGQYGNGRLALTVLGKQGQPICKLTVNLEDMAAGPNQFYRPRGEYHKRETSIIQELERRGLVRPLNVIVTSPEEGAFADLWELVV